MTTSQTENEADWSVECSDEETYSKNWTRRKVSGKTVWEPSGKQIAFLYQQLEKTGCMDVRWQCPGRRSPSVHSVSQAAGDKKSGGCGGESGSSSAKAAVVTEFDFDEEFADTSAATAKLTSIPNRRKPGNQTSNAKKGAKLDKVMNDMKKYQIIDQQSRQDP